jgi:hypothetical protein
LHRQWPLGCDGLDADDPAAVHAQPQHLGAHPKVEGGIAPRAAGEEIEEVPLGHEGDELAARRQVAEVCQRHDLGAEAGAQRGELLVGQREKLLENAQLAHELERRGMNGVPSEVAEKIRMLLQHDHRHPRAGQEEREHHAGGAAPGDAALCSRGLAAHIPSVTLTSTP